MVIKRKLTHATTVKEGSPLAHFRETKCGHKDTNEKCREIEQAKNTVNVIIELF